MNLTGKVIAPEKWHPLATGFDSAQYSGAIEWEDGDGEPVVAGSFAGEAVVYRATVNLSAKTGFTFVGIAADSFAWSGYGPEQIRNPANSGRVTITFPATAAANEDTPVNIFSLDNRFALPVTGGVPLSDFAETSQYTGTLRWFNGEDIPVSGTFAASVAYKAKIAPTTKAGYTLAGIASNAFVHTGASSVTWDAGTGTVSIVFPGTAEDAVLVNNLFLEDKVIPPMAGLEPVTEFPGTDQYNVSIVWETAMGGAAGAGFAAGTAYRAVVTLTAKPGWTFNGLGENAFSYSGAASVTNGPGSGVVTIVFFPTPKPPSNWSAIGDTKFDTVNLTSTIYSVAHGNGKYVAVGVYGQMAWSANGIEWTAISPGSTTGSTTFSDDTIYTVSYGGEKFIAAGIRGKMAWSDDGVIWTAISPGTASDPGDTTFGQTDIQAVSYGGGKYVAAGSGKMAWSANGIHWTAISPGTASYPGDTTFGNDGINAVSYGSEKFVAVGNRGKMAWSVDGIHWTAINPGTASYPGDTTFGNDGINAVSYGSRKFVAVGNHGKMAWSVDGIYWTAISPGSATDPGDTTFGNSAINAVCYGGGNFVATGASGKMAWSFNGTNWVAVNGSPFGTSAVNGVTYGDGKFVAVGAVGKAAYSAGVE
jgi:hypothetical protein